MDILSDSFVADSFLGTDSLAKSKIIVQKAEKVPKHSHLLGSIAVGGGCSIYTPRSCTYSTQISFSLNFIKETYRFTG